MKLQIQEHALAHAHEFSHDRRPRLNQQLQINFVVLRARTKAGNKRQRLGLGFIVKSNDYGGGHGGNSGEGGA